MTRFWQDESGSTAIEYGLVALLLAVALVGSITVVSGEVKKLYGQVISGFLQNANSGG